MPGSFGRTEQEERIESLYKELDDDFKKVAKAKDSAKVTALLKDITSKLKDAKTLIKDFEREARTDGMPARELADRKRHLVEELNNFIAKKKEHSSTENARGELIGAAAAPTQVEMGSDGKSIQQLVVEGKKNIQEIDAGLTRTEKMVEDTIQIGQQTAATLNDQTQQLNKIVDDLNEIEFTMKKASKVIRDIGKGIMTDRCISFLLFLVVAGVIALVIVKVINPHKKEITAAAAAAYNATGVADLNISGSIQNGLSQAQQAITGRRLVMHMLGMATGGGAGGPAHPWEPLVA